MKIALLTDGITPFVTGGMQRHSANLAKYFTIVGVEVTLVHCVRFDEKIPSIEEVNGSLFGNNPALKLNAIFTLHFPKSGKIPGHYIRNSYRYSKIIYNLLNWNEFDFVYAKGYCGWYYLKQKEKGVKLPPIGVKFHGYEMFQPSESLMQKIQSKMLQKATRWNTQHADVVFSYGGAITKLIAHKLNVPFSRIIELTSGIDQDWIRNSAEIQTRQDRLKFVFVGRNEKRKGLEDLNKAIKKVLESKITDFEFHFIGPIPSENQLQIENITYHGQLTNRQEIMAILDQMDVLVCPSHSEGMPNVILEGMSRGVAIIATDVGAVNQLIDEHLGLLIKPFDPESLANSLKKMIELKSTELLQLKYKALEKINAQFEWSLLIQELISQMQQKLKGGNS